MLVDTSKYEKSETKVEMSCESILGDVKMILEVEQEVEGAAHIQCKTQFQSVLFSVSTANQGQHN